MSLRIGCTRDPQSGVEECKEETPAEKRLTKIQKERERMAREVEEEARRAAEEAAAAAAIVSCDEERMCPPLEPGEKALTACTHKPDDDCFNDIAFRAGDPDKDASQPSYAGYAFDTMALPPSASKKATDEDEEQEEEETNFNAAEFNSMVGCLFAANKDADFREIYKFDDSDKKKKFARTHMRAMETPLALPKESVETIKVEYGVSMGQAARLNEYQRHASIRNSKLFMADEAFNDCLLLDGNRIQSKLVAEDRDALTHGILVAVQFVEGKNQTGCEYDFRVAFPEEHLDGVQLRTENCNTARVNANLLGGRFCKVVDGEPKKVEMVYQIDPNTFDSGEQFRWMQLTRKDFEDAAESITTIREVRDANGKKTGEEVPMVPIDYDMGKTETIEDTLVALKGANLVDLIGISYAHDVRQRYEEHGYSLADLRWQIESGSDMLYIRRDVFFMVVDYYLKRYDRYRHQVNLSRSYALLRRLNKGIKWDHPDKEIRIEVEYHVMPLPSRTKLVDPIAFHNTIDNVLPGFLHERDAGSD